MVKDVMYILFSSVSRLRCQPGHVRGIMTMPTISVVDCKTGQSSFMTSETLPVM